MPAELIAHYSKRFRAELGFSSQGDAKAFLAGKDISPPIDQAYVDQLLTRLAEILRRLDATVSKTIRQKNIDRFIEKAVFDPARVIQSSGILPRLNNQGRRPEEVLFSWLRGYTIVEYFSPAVAHIFGIQKTKLFRIGDDDFRNPDTFRRTPTADLRLTINNTLVHIEVQSGFQGINDIKEHKLREARRLWRENRIPTICIHFDIFNGQAAFVRLDQINENDIHMVTRQQMEGQSVFAIDPNHFLWRLLDAAPGFSTLDIDLQ